MLYLFVIADITGKGQYFAPGFLFHFCCGFLQYLQFAAGDDQVGTQFKEIGAHGLAQACAPAGNNYCFTF
ncbi:hypothetical protein D3C86_1378490 [compost metagenome]